MTDDERREDEPDGEAEASLRVRMGAALVTVVLVVGCVAAFVATLGICAQQVEAPGAMVAGSWIRLEGCGPALEQMGALRLSSLWLDAKQTLRGLGRSERLIAEICFLFVVNFCVVALLVDKLILGRKHGKLILGRKHGSVFRKRIQVTECV